MEVKQIKGATRTLGVSQGYIGLPIRDEKIKVVIGEKEEEVDAMFSVWRPSPGELIQLNNGAGVRICILGSKHPPILVEVSKEDLIPELVVNNSN